MRETDRMLVWDWFHRFLGLLIVFTIVSVIHGCSTSTPPTLAGKTATPPELRWSQWRMLGPFSASDVAILGTGFIPDLGSGTMVPSASGTLRWTDVPQWDLDWQTHFFETPLGVEPPFSTCYVTRAFSSESGGEAYWYTSSDDYLTGWLDGRRIVSWAFDGGHAERRRCHRIAFSPGTHTVLLRVENLTSRFSFFSWFEPIADPVTERRRLISLLTEFPRSGDPVSASQLFRQFGLPDEAVWESWRARASCTSPILNPVLEIQRMHQDLRTVPDEEMRSWKAFRLVEFYRELGLGDVARSWFTKLCRIDRMRSHWPGIRELAAFPPVLVLHSRLPKATARIGRQNNHWSMWETAGPFRNEDVASWTARTIDQDLQSAKRPITSRAHLWKKVFDWGSDAYYHDLGALWGSNIDGVSAFARRRFFADQAGEAYWYTSCDDLLKTWFDGRPVFTWNTEGWNPPRFRCQRVSYSRGWHELLLRVTNKSGACGFTSSFEPIADPKAERAALITRLNGTHHRTLKSALNGGSAMGLTPLHLMKLLEMKIPAQENDWVYVASFARTMTDPASEMDRVLSEIQQSSDPLFLGFAWYRLLELFRQVGLGPVVRKWLASRTVRSASPANNSASISLNLVFGHGWDKEVDAPEKAPDAIALATWETIGPFSWAEADRLQTDLPRLTASGVSFITASGTRRWQGVEQWGNDLDPHSFLSSLHVDYDLVSCFVRRVFTACQPGEAYWYNGVDDFSRAWIDGKPLHEWNFRNATCYRRGCLRIVYASGTHELLIRVDNKTGSHMFYSLLEPIPQPREERHRLIRLVREFPKRTDDIEPWELLKSGEWKKLPDEFENSYIALCGVSIIDPGTEITRLQGFLRGAHDPEARLVGMFRLMEFYRELGLETVARSWLHRLSRLRGTSLKSLTQSALQAAHRGDPETAMPLLLRAVAFSSTDPVLLNRLVLLDLAWNQVEGFLLTPGSRWDRLSRNSMANTKEARTWVGVALANFFHCRTDLWPKLFALVSQVFPDSLDLLNLRSWLADAEHETGGGVEWYRRFLAAEERLIRRLQERIEP